jgi:hypothetical protein
MASPRVPVSRPKLFVGSSTAGRETVVRLAGELHDVADVTTWCDGSPGPLPAGFDAAAFALCGAPEWGVFLRLGMFLGALGRERIIVVPAEARAVYLPQELAGLIVKSEVAAIREHLLQLAVTPDNKVARRRRRTLGDASSQRSQQPLRIADISLTGALLETYGEIPENQMLDLELALDNGRRIRVGAKVVRVQHPQWGRVGGVGVQFTRFEGDSYKILEEFLEADPAGKT